jgi:ATP-dependent HslUV protease ATP-binding subunit HslU
MYWCRRRVGLNLDASDTALCLTARRRQVFRKKLREGLLDDKEIEIDVEQGKAQLEIMGPAGMEEMTEQLRGMFSQLGKDKAEAVRRLSIQRCVEGS